MRREINDLINNSDSILLLTHENPDGDAIGSVLGFYHYLVSINKSVDMAVWNLPEVFDFLPSVDRVVDSVDKNYDLGIVLDCASLERIGQNDDLFSKCKNTLCIDHHISNTKYCNVNLIEGEISSCSQVVYSLFKDLNVSISKEIGESLITGVITDTCGFKINSVDSNTFKMAAEILNLNIDIHSIYENVLSKKSMAKHNLMKLAMDRLEFLADGKIAFTYISNDDFTNVGAIYGEHEGIVDIGRNISGVEVSIFIREDNDGFTISLRSTGLVDVSNIAAKVGGGGHFMAAGAKTRMNFEETKELIINETKKVLI